jgi:hypothetical protein
VKPLALAIVLIVAVAGTLPAQPPPTPDAKWQKFSDTPGRFSVLLPGTPTTDPPIVDANGLVTQVFALRQDGKVYVVVYNDSDTSDVAARLDQARDEFLKSLPATFTSGHRFQSTQPAGSVPAVQFTCRNPEKNVECKARTFVIARRGYMVVSVNVTGTGSSVDTDKFLDSFQILSASR